MMLSFFSQALGLENFFVGVGIEHKHVLPSPTIG
jgi:hypothetical protein